MNTELPPPVKRPILKEALSEFTYYAAQHFIHAYVDDVGCSDWDESYGTAAENFYTALGEESPRTQYLQDVVSNIEHLIQLEAITGYEFEIVGAYLVALDLTETPDHVLEELDREPPTMTGAPY